MCDGLSAAADAQWVTFTAGLELYDDSMKTLSGALQPIRRNE